MRSSLSAGGRVHVELFAARKVVVVPATIGLRGASLRFGRVTTARCRMRVWTTDPSGIVRFAGAATLGTLFQVWGRRLEPRRLLSFSGRVRLYRNGTRVRADVRAEPFRNGDELVLEVGAYVVPHRSFRFPRRTAHAGPGVPLRRSTTTTTPTAPRPTATSAAARRR